MAMFFFNQRNIFKVRSNQRKQNTAVLYRPAGSARCISYCKMLGLLNFVKSVVNSINIDVIEKLALRLCAFHTFKTRIAPAPRPIIRQFKRNLIIDIHDLAANLLIIRGSHIFPL